VGLEASDEWLLKAYLGPVRLGRLDERTQRIDDPKSRAPGQTVSPCRRIDLSAAFPTVHDRFAPEPVVNLSFRISWESLERATSKNHRRDRYTTTFDAVLHFGC
jgi:hypothetical protein